ncbi:MAG: response regulator [Gammaproteobacteria bacterium]|nr:response regulator [Gammaproteobacteria bacterium]
MNLTEKVPVHTKRIQLIIALVFSSLFLLYLLPIIPTEKLAFFSYHFADLIFLTLILSLIALRFLRSQKHGIDKLFWSLFGGAFLSWWLLTLVFNIAWQDLSSATQNLVSGISYFLFYALMIASVELKSHRAANQLLSLHSSLIWLSTLSFALGAFIYLVIIPSTTAQGSVHNFPTTYLFYLLMDSYLMLRWGYLAYQCRVVDWKAFGLIALAMSNWLIADTVEALNLFTSWNLSGGSFLDWIWFTPYLWIALAMTLRLTNSESASFSKRFSRLNLLNSPLTFVALTLMIYAITNNNILFKPIVGNTHHAMFTGWLVLGLVLAITQIGFLIKQSASLRYQLKESQFATESLKQQLEQQAKKTEAQRDSYRSILETTSNAIFTVEESGKILSANSAATRLLDYSNAELLHMSIQDLIDSEDELALFFKFQSYRQKLERQNRGLELESEFLSQSGNSVLVHVTVSKGKPGSGTPLVIALADIREQKQAEKEIMRMKDEFTANISHEFRTPLTIINGVLDNLSKQTQDAAALQQIETAKNNGLRMVRMVEQLLELSRSGRHAITVAPMDAGAVCQFVAQNFRAIALEKNIEFYCADIPSIWVKGNIQAFEKIIFNLLSNAFKYTPSGGRVALNFASHDGVAQLDVSDNGPGIPAQEQDKIFQRFYRAEGTNSKQIHGVGIGLALVKELCRSMGWHMTLNSNEGAGSTFSVTMQQIDIPDNYEAFTPKINQPIEQNIESELVDTKAEQQSLSIQKSKYLVLVIEDNVDMQRHLNGIIAEHHQCLIASNGEEGIKMALDYLPDIIVSDVMMPGIDGFETLKILRRNELTAHIPVLMLTARSDIESKIEGLEAEADDYLTKPFDARELLLRLKNQIQSRLKLQQRLQSQWQTESSASDSGTKKIEDKFLIKLNECFAEHYQDSELSMAVLASKLAMSERQLQRKVKALLDLSPLEALRSFRINQSKQLLREKEQVGIVAQKVGFSSQSHFGRLFKEQVGMTPGEYQKRT